MTTISNIHLHIILWLSAYWQIICYSSVAGHMYCHHRNWTILMMLNVSCWEGVLPTMIFINPTWHVPSNINILFLDWSSLTYYYFLNELTEKMFETFQPQLWYWKNMFFNFKVLKKVFLVSSFWILIQLIYRTFDYFTPSKLAVLNIYFINKCQSLASECTVNVDYCGGNFTTMHVRSIL